MPFSFHHPFCCDCSSQELRRNKGLLNVWRGEWQSGWYLSLLCILALLHSNSLQRTLIIPLICSCCRPLTSWSGAHLPSLLSYALEASLHSTCSFVASLGTIRRKDCVLCNDSAARETSNVDPGEQRPELKLLPWRASQQLLLKFRSNC